MTHVTLLFCLENQGSGTAAESEEKCTESVSADVDEEAEAWSERTAVITRYDHETHCQLARSFVEDLADKVVADNWKPKDEEVLEEAVKVSEQVEEFKVPAQPPAEKPSLKLQKQALFLPNLVPNVVIVKPSVPPSESESDEYASADEEQTQSLHGNKYFFQLYKSYSGFLKYKLYFFIILLLRYALLRLDCQSFINSQRFYANRYFELAFGL